MNVSHHRKTFHKGGLNMTKQLIISIGREFGSGGHEIAAELAKRFSLPIYDYNLISKIADEKDMEPASFEKYDEVPKKIAFSKTVRGYSSSPEENIANIQFDYLRDKASSGESFVVVGRCSEEILKEYEGLITFFVHADLNVRIRRIADYEKISERKAEFLIKRRDKARKTYHNYYCSHKWGDYSFYDLSINSSKLGIAKTTDFLESYIRQKTGVVQ